jgi:hypothetical protein
MADATNESLTQRSNQIHNRYIFAFAGKPRATRRIEEMDAIIRDADALLAEVTRANTQGAGADLVRERAALYVSERQAIASAQAAGPLVRAAAVLATRANFAFSLYRRHFAGLDRRTRDAALLQDVIAWLEQVQSDLSQIGTNIAETGVHDDLDLIGRNMEAYRNEVNAILEARTQGTIEERAGRLADRANGQFEAYRVHFAGRERLSRRPALLRRLVASVDGIGNEMAAVSREGFNSDFHVKNRDIVAERLKAYRAEQEAVSGVREKTDVDSLIGALAREANAIMEEYNRGFAGQERATRDLGALSAIIDRMIEIERQMWDLDRALEDPTNARNLSIVQDMLLVYLREYDQIREARTN